MEGPGASKGHSDGEHSDSDIDVKFYEQNQTMSDDAFDFSVDENIWDTSRTKTVVSAKNAAFDPLHVR